MPASLLYSMMPRLLPRRLTREKTASLGASIAVNLAMIAAFASIADIGVQEVQNGSSLVVVGLTGTEAKSEAAKEKKPAPAPPVPTPNFAGPDEKPLAPRIALQQRPEPVPERTDAVPPPAQAEAQTGPSPDQLREAQEAAGAHAADLGQSEARPATGGRAQQRSSERAEGSDGYKAVVWRHLQRFRRTNTIGAGTTMVRFTIDDGGGVLNVGVARSSGSAAFDREALRMVRRAAPFPKPPQSVGRDFVFAIEGK